MMAENRVLWLEADPELAERLQCALRDGPSPASLVRVRGHQEFLEALRSGPWDVIVVPCRSAAATATRDDLDLAVAEQPGSLTIVLAAEPDDGTLAAALARGAFDCIPSRWPERLVHGVARALRLVRERRDQSRVVDELMKQTACLDENPNPVLRVDASGSLLYANAAARTLVLTWPQEGPQRLPGEWAVRLSQSLATGVRGHAEFGCGGRTYGVDFVPASGGTHAHVYAYDVTDLESTRHELETVRRLQQAILDSIPDIAWLKDRDSRFLMVNEAFGQSCGVAPAELVGKTDLDIWPLELAERYRKDDREVMETRERKQVEEPLADARGRVTWIETIKTPLSDDRGQLVGTAGIARDITDRKRTERALMDSEEKFHAIFRQSPIGIAVLDPDARILDANPSALAIFGVAGARALCGTRVLDDPGMPDEVKRHLRASEPVQGEFRYDFDAVRRAGTYPTSRTGRRWLAFDLVGLGPQGTSRKSDRYLLHVQDVTERRLSQDAVQQFKSLADHACYGVAVATADGVLTYCNESLARMHGFAPTEMIGHPISSFHTPEQMANLDTVLDILRRWGSFLGQEVWHLHRDGTVFPTVMNGNLLTAVAGEPSLLALTAVDARGHVALENELRQAHTMEAVGQLAAGVAHDFNNLLQRILGFAYAAQEEAGAASAAADLLSEVIDAAEEASELVAKLLTCGRRDLIRPEDLDLNDCIRQHLPMLELLAGTGSRVDFRAGQGLGSIQFDPAHLERTLISLIHNARDAMPAGGVVTLETKLITLDAQSRARWPWARSGRYVCLSVGDTGAGISPGDLDHIFEPFFTTKGVGKGRGLGLAAVYGGVKRVGGLVRVESQPGHGTRFELLFPPADPADAAAAAAAPQAAEPTATPDPDHVVRTILLADDDELIRMLGQRILGDAGYRVLLASDGDGALSVFRTFEGTIDLALIDLAMPGRSSRAVAAEMRQLRPALAVLFTSGYSFGNLMGRRPVAEGLLYVEKPFSPPALLRQVREALAGAAPEP